MDTALDRLRRRLLPASLLPLAAYLVAVELPDGPGLRWASAPLVVLLYAGFVSVPTIVALAAARHGAVWWTVLGVMTATAATAGVLVATTDDAQAGLAVLIVWYVALPLAVVVAVGEAVAARVRGAGR